jgi:hypothetical protein
MKTDCAKGWQQMTSAIEFFKAHAGFSYGTGETPEQGQLRCAQELARAEAYASEHGWVAEWRDDDERAYCYCDDPNCRYHEGSDHDWDTLYCVLYRPCSCNRCSNSHRDILGSLSGIMDPDANYRRVVEAELALEALAEIERGDRAEVVPHAAT